MSVLTTEGLNDDSCAITAARGIGLIPSSLAALTIDWTRLSLLKLIFSSSSSASKAFSLSISSCVASVKKPASKLLLASPSMSSKFWLSGVAVLLFDVPESGWFVCVLKGLTFFLALLIYLPLISSIFSITVKVSASLPSGPNM